MDIFLDIFGLLWLFDYHRLLWVHSSLWINWLDFRSGSGDGSEKMFIAEFFLFNLVDNSG